MPEVTFFRVDCQGQLQWVAADDGEHIYGYLPETKDWRRNPALEEDVASFPDNEMVFTEISPEEACKLLKQVPKPDGRAWGWMLDRFKELPLEEVRSSAEFGVGGAPGRLVMSRLAKDPYRWVTVRSFPPEKHSSARVLASDIRAGKKKWQKPSAAAYEARTVGTDPVKTQVRLAGVPSMPTDEAVSDGLSSTKGKASAAS